MKKGQHCAPPAPMRKGKKALLIVTIILALIAIAVVAYSLWERPPEIATSPKHTAKPSTAQSAQAGTEPGTSSSGDVGEQGEFVPGEEAPEETDFVNSLETDRVQGTYTFLLVGRDHASNSTDTIIVGRMDTKKHTIDCVSIPRDTLINIGWANTPKRINAVYPGYINSGKNGIDGLKDHIRNLVGFDIDCYAVVSIKAVEEAVDCIGGVWFDVPVDMRYNDPTQNLNINIDKGYQLLNGEDSVKVCRFRNTYAGGDIDRIGVQQSFLKAAASQILTLGNIPNLGELVDILVENTDTDLDAANIAWFIRQFLLCKMDNISFQTMPWSVGCTINGVSFVSVDLDNWLDMVNDKLNPYVEPVTTANVNILTSNTSGTLMQSTTGAVAGGADSFYCLTCTVKNGGKAVHHLPGCCPNG